MQVMQTSHQFLRVDFQLQWRTKFGRPRNRSDERARTAATDTWSDFSCPCSDRPRPTSTTGRAVFAQAASAKDDSCTVLLPAAESVPKLLELDAQVGSTRNLIVINPQWKRRSDFGGFGTFFGPQGGQHTAFVERFEPTFSLTNMICEGESIRILRTYPGMWRVYLRQFNDDDGSVDWKCVGSQAVLDRNPTDWETRPGNQQDGGKLFDFGQPTYQDVLVMLQSSSEYKAKNPAERAAAAFDFIKDSL